MISIVVLTYNNLQSTTLPCIESILANTPAGTYELIVVDNASSDGTPDYLKSVSEANNHIEIKLNAINKGYAAGNNDGIKMAKGSIIVLLNNDTLVPEGWLENLTIRLQSDRKTGMVGPVTNSAGNEQTVSLPNLNEKNYGKISQLYVSRHKGIHFQTNRLGFFCVAIKRNVFEKIGMLDEKFGIGMFEDDDLCLRAIKAGFNLTIAEDCFVYHKGSVSFSKLSNDIYQDLFQKNKSYFEAKHGVKWSFGQIAIQYANKIDTDLQHLRGEFQNTPPGLERILSRWETFHHLLKDLNAIENQLSEAQQDFQKGASRPTIWQQRFSQLKEDFVFGTPRSRKQFLIKLSKKFGFNN